MVSFIHIDFSDKELVLFKSGITKEIFEEFFRHNQLNRSQMKSPPFAFVDPETGEIKLLSNLMMIEDGSHDWHAFSVECDGGLGILTTES